MRGKRSDAEPFVRVAAEGDLDALLRLEQMFDTDQMTRRALAASLRSPTQLVLVAGHSRDVIGSAIVHLRRNSVAARLYSLAVSAAARRAGIGTALLRTIERKAREWGASSVHLEVRSDNGPAWAFYLRNGYVLFGRHEGYYQDGCAALRLCKSLAKRRLDQAPRLAPHSPAETQMRRG